MSVGSNNDVQPITSQARIACLEAEIQRLRAQIAGQAETIDRLRQAHAVHLTHRQSIAAILAIDIDPDD